MKRTAENQQRMITLEAVRPLSAELMANLPINAGHSCTVPGFIKLRRNEMPTYKFNFDLVIKETDRVFVYQPKVEIVIDSFPGRAVQLLKQKYNIENKSEIQNLMIEVILDPDMDNHIN